MKANLTSLNKLLSTNVLAFHFKEGDFWSSYADIFILSCGIAVLQNQALCGIYKLSGNFNTVCDFLTLFYAVFLIILRGFAVFVPAPPPAPVLFKVKFDQQYVLRYVGHDSLQTGRYKTREL